MARAWFDDYDIVLAASERIVDMVRRLSSKTASLLPIATNPDRFQGHGSRPDLACDVLFMGSYWGQPRDVIDALPALAERGYSVRVYGRGWEDVPGMAALHRGFLAYDDVPRAYASARIVVDDATEPTKACGSVNSRVFDALAMGAVVVSSGELGVHDLFDVAFPTWSDGPSLTALVESILHEPEPYLARAGGYQSLVLAGAHVRAAGAGRPGPAGSVGVRHALRPAHRSPELGRRRDLGRSPLRPCAAALTRTGRPPDPRAPAARLGCARRCPRRRGPAHLRSQGGADEVRARSICSGTSVTRIEPARSYTTATTMSSSPRMSSPRAWHRAPMSP